MDAATRRLLARYAERYETEDFLQGDPSWFMHQVAGDANREATAFVASGLSFGSRAQFLPRIQRIVDCAEGDVDGWIRNGCFERNFPAGSCECFYRFFSIDTMNRFFRAYRSLMSEYGTLGEFVRRESGGDGLRAVGLICSRLATDGEFSVVPKDAKSACKRVCMFLRWMVRGGSPVDLGLWAGFMDRRTLIVPLDTHVVQEARRLGLLSSPCASMCAARRLTAALREAFPDDPLKGDFALFGYGVDEMAQKGEASNGRA